MSDLQHAVARALETIPHGADCPSLDLGPSRDVCGVCTCDYSERLAARVAAAILETNFVTFNLTWTRDAADGKPLSSPERATAQAGDGSQVGDIPTPEQEAAIRTQAFEAALRALSPQEEPK